MRQRMFLLALSVLMVSSAVGQFIDSTPKYETRAVWLTTIGGIDWPHSYAQGQRSVAKQQAELVGILDQLQRAGINQVLLQTRIRATTIYPSSFEPWDGCLSGFPDKSPGYDALQFAIDECHRRGMELHAWLVTIPVGRWNGAGCKSLRKRFPRLIKKIGDEGFMNPEDPQTAAYMADLCEEIVRRYDVDGIHLDYIRYPETWNIKVTPSRGRQYITHIVQAIHDRIKPLKPYVKLSCAPIGKSDDLTRFSSYGWNAYSRVCQDAQGWLRDGLMDQLFPMMYFRGRQFFPFAIDWSENSYGRIVTPGLGIYFLSPREKDWSLDVITREMDVLRRYGLGHAFFRSKFFTDNTKGIYEFTLQHNAALALVPPMTWMENQCPKAPICLTLSDDGRLSWSGPYSCADILYNVYASNHYPVDTNDGANLVAIRLTRPWIDVPSRQLAYYAVTAMNRYGVESVPLQMEAPSCKRGVAVAAQLACDGQHLLLPAYKAAWERQLVAQITDLSGHAVKTAIWKGDKMDIGSLDEGVYQLYSITSRGVRHRHGFFVIRRH